MQTKRREISYDKLLELVATLQARIAEQDKRIAKLEAQLAAANKNSRNSSKPPSSDITKPNGKKRSGSRKRRDIGGQKGHPKNESNLIIDDADHVVAYHAHQLPENLELELVSAPGLEPRTLFQHELVDKPVELTAHVSYPYLNPETGEVVYASFPREVEAAGILGPRLTAFAACLKGGIHASYTGTEKVLGFLGTDDCRATICNKIKKVTAALSFAHG